MLARDEMHFCALPSRSSYRNGESPLTDRAGKFLLRAALSSRSFGRSVGCPFREKFCSPACSVRAGDGNWEPSSRKVGARRPPGIPDRTKRPFGRTVRSSCKKAGLSDRPPGESILMDQKLIVTPSDNLLTVSGVSNVSGGQSPRASTPILTLFTGPRTITSQSDLA